MIEREYVLSEQRTVTVAADGTALVDGLGPVAPFERWEISSTQVLCTSAAQSKLLIYDNSALSRLVEGTYSGNQDNTNTAFKLQSGQKLYYRWTGADVGTFATVTLNGSRYVAVR